jgi:hypothetical protein
VIRAIFSHWSFLFLLYDDPHQSNNPLYDSLPRIISSATRISSSLGHHWDIFRSLPVSHLESELHWNVAQAEISDVRKCYSPGWCKCRGRSRIWAGIPGSDVLNVGKKVETEFSFCSEFERTRGW